MGRAIVTPASSSRNGLPHTLTPSFLVRSAPLQKETKMRTTSVERVCGFLVAAGRECCSRLIRIQIVAGAAMVLLAAAPSLASPRVVLISLDGATPALVEQFMR